MPTTLPPSKLPVPPRHPARLLGTKFDDAATQANNLTSEQLDLWEHATVLYHGFDWHSSAETFLFLSRTINRNLESTLCLLNAAMVFARLGEYATAAQILDEAEPDERTLAFTMFLMGHVEFEIGNFDKAQDCLKVALHSLNGSSQRLYDLGLEYVLRASHIQQNLRIFESKRDLVGMLGSLGALPADGVFEAPPRRSGVAAPQPISATVNSRNSIDSDELPPLTDDSSSSELGSPIESVTSSKYDSDGMRWHDLPDDPEVHTTAPTMMSSKAKGKQPVTILEPSAANRDTAHLSARFSNVLPAFRKARRPTWEPREARVQGDSVGGLADFIRDLPSQKPGLKPKEAKVQEETTASLADFLRTSGPGQANAQATRDDDSDRSVYSNDSEAASICSDDLRKMVEEHNASVTHRGVEPAPSRHPYRSGFGSMLLKENQRPSKAHRRANEPLEATPLTSDALHDLLGDGSDSVSMDWPLTSEASRSLRQSFISAASSHAEIPAPRRMNRNDMPEPLRVRDNVRPAPAAATPAIPTRRSSLFRRHQNSPSDKRASRVSSSNFFSHVANLK